MTTETQRKWAHDYYLKNKERYKSLAKKWREGHREELREKQRKYRAENLEAVRARQRVSAKAWRLAHQERSRETVRKANRTRKEKLKKKVFDMYGNKCFLKDEHCDGWLTIDHVNGKQFDKRGPKMVTKNTEVFYKWLTDEKRSGFVTLCSRHNNLKGGFPPRLMIEYANKLLDLEVAEAEML